MKKHKINLILGLLLIAVSTAMLLTGCVINGNVIGLSDYRYDNAENYTVGDAQLTNKVENVEIDWISGNVKVLTHEGKTVSFVEESENELTEDTKLHYWLDGTTLRIKFCACGKWDFSEMDKDLTVYLPETLVLDNLKVNGLSADVTLTNCAVSQLVKINTLSGKLDAELTKPLEEFNGNSTSGAFKISAPSVSRFDADTISGAISLSVQKEPSWLDIDATSGSVSLVLPKTASFRLDFDATSGKLSSDLFYSKSAGKYVFGDGDGEYEITTISGDVSIMAND